MRAIYGRRGTFRVKTKDEIEEDERKKKEEKAKKQAKVAEQDDEL